MSRCLLAGPVIILCGVSLVFGQSSAGDTRREPANSAATPGSAVPLSVGANATGPGALSPESPGAPVDTKTYIIGAEDVLGVSVWREPELTRAVVVRPDGKISMPMIGEIQAAGATPEDLGKRLTQAFTKFINNPEVLVSVQQVNSKKYYIDGAVNRPGEYHLITPTTVLEALSQAGGFREFANTKKIRILRGTTTLKFNYKQVSHGKHMDQNIYLQDGDHVFVDE
ncbi:MAG TPA: polysaccharide biosynthesis/export family protein [Bryobacteraceae bacterium]|nr:polysaccharide biosynthesis/export family protein [Bryobacteraceae bacterium]